MITIKLTKELKYNTVIRRNSNITNNVKQMIYIILEQMIIQNYYYTNNII